MLNFGTKFQLMTFFLLLGTSLSVIYLFYWLGKRSISGLSEQQYIEVVSSQMLWLGRKKRPLKSRVILIFIIGFLSSFVTSVGLFAPSMVNLQHFLFEFLINRFIFVPVITNAMRTMIRYWNVWNRWGLWCSVIVQ